MNGNVNVMDRIFIFFVLLLVVVFVVFFEIEDIMVDFKVSCI